MTVDADTFKDLMARFPAGVTVVTTRHDDARYGLTVSAFASISLDPPLVLISIAEGADSHDRIREAGVFGVSYLSEKQAHLSDRFAGFDDVEDPFTDVPTTTLETGAPLLSDAVAHVDCRVESVLDGGDHTLFLGRVVAGDVLRPEARPLVYWDRGYHGIGPTPGGGD